MNKMKIEKENFNYFEQSDIMSGATSPQEVILEREKEGWTDEEIEYYHRTGEVPIKKKMKNKIHISWRGYGILIEELINKVKREGTQFDGVFGIPRGGAPIALAFSHALDIPVLLYPTSRSIIVDDLSDTGATLRGIKNKKIATLHSTKWTKVVPDYWVDEKLNEDDWIVYPYEND